jgi:hypothetical protein
VLCRTERVAILSQVSGVGLGPYAKGVNPLFGQGFSLMFWQKISRKIPCSDCLAR